MQSVSSSTSQRSQSGQDASSIKTTKFREFRVLPRLPRSPGQRIRTTPRRYSAGPKLPGCYEPCSRSPHQLRREHESGQDARQPKQLNFRASRAIPRLPRSPWRRIRTTPRRYGAGTKQPNHAVGLLINFAEKPIRARRLVKPKQLISAHSAPFRAFRVPQGNAVRTTPRRYGAPFPPCDP